MEKKIKRTYLPVDFKVEQNLIRKVAWSFHRTTGMDWETLYSEASYAYCIGLSAYRHSMGNKVTSFLYMRMTNHLIDYIKKEKQRQHSSLNEVSDHALYTNKATTTQQYRESIVECFNNDAKTIVEFLIQEANQPLERKRTRGKSKSVQLHEAIDFDATPTKIKGQLKKYLTELGWSQSKIKNSFSEIKETLLKL